MSSVGQGLGAVVGGVIGFVATGTPVGALKGAAYGAAIGGVLDPAALPGYDGPRLGDLSEQTSGYGVGLHRAHGKIKLNGHVFWIENNKRAEVPVKQETGGKGGGGSQESTTYEYFGTFAVMLCDHQIQGIERLWDVNGLVLNTVGTDVDTAYATSDVFPLAHLYNPGSEAQLKSALQTSPSPGPNGQIRLYPGFDDQMPDPRMEADLGVGNCSAYRGCAYLMFYDWPLPQEYGQSIAGAQISCEVVVDGSAGAAVLLNEIKINAPAGFYDQTARAHYLTKDRVRIYYDDASVGPANFASRTIGPHGEEPRNTTYPILGVDLTPLSTYASGKGLTLRDVGPISLYNVGSHISAFPGGPTDLEFGRFVRDGAELLSGSWFAIKTTPGKLFHGDEATDSFTEITFAENPYEIAMDGDGNAVVMFLNRLEIYDTSLSLIRTIDTTGLAGVGGAATYDGVWMAFDNNVLWVGRGAGNHPGDLYAFDLTTETVAGPISLRDLDVVYPGSSINEFAARFNIDGQIAIRFTSYFASTAIYDFDDIVEFYRLPTPSGTGEDLATVTRNLIEQSELIESADIDVTDLAGTVRGYQYQGVGSIRSRLEPLMLGYQFDLIQDGYTLKAVTRGNSSVITVDPDDLDARAAGEKPGDALTHSREMDTQLPSVVVCKALDADRDYEVNEQRSQTMEASSSVNVQELNLPIVFTPNEAAGIAEIVWARRWLERESYSFRLPPTYLNLQPADVITVPMSYATYEFFVTRANFTVDGRVECEAVLNDSAIYTPNAVGSNGNASSTTVAYGGNSVLIPLDIPLIYDEYDKYGYPAAMAGYSPTWPGGVLVRSTDTGQTWQPVQGYAGPVVSGVVETPLGQDDGYVINYTDQLTVEFYSSDMSISSITEAQMKTGMNWFAYGATGRWEIGLFANATDNGDGTWTLDTILRGAKGTEWATGLHAAYDQFVFLSDADLQFIGSDVNSRGVERLLKGPTTGQDIDNVPSQAFTYTGVNLKPYAPAQLDANLSGADWVITWKRRTRLETSYFTNGTAVPLGEASEAYEIDIIDTSVSPNVVVRTLDAASETVTYTSAQQNTDFGSGQSSITFRVYQISAIVGRSYESEATV